MNHWKETADVLARLAAISAAGRRAALARVVHIAGSAYRRPGAKLLIVEDGDTLGSVSGGCMEADVREVASAVIESGAPALRHYHAGDDSIVGGLGLGCNGLVDIFVQPATRGALSSAATPLRQRLAADAPFALATIVDDGPDIGATVVIDPTDPADRHGSLGSASLDRQVVARARDLMATDDAASDVYAIAGRQIFIELLRPPPHLLVCGANADAVPLVAYAADVGFRVTVLDHRPALLAPESFPGAATLILAHPGDPDAALAISAPPPARSLAVVKNHSLAHDREWVRLLLAKGLPYVGVLGPRDRTESILRDLCLSSDDRVFGPVGLDLGADGAQQVAISIVAELLAVLTHREPRHLWQRREAIHAG